MDVYRSLILLNIVVLVETFAFCNHEYTVTKFKDFEFADIFVTIVRTVK